MSSKHLLVFLMLALVIIDSQGTRYRSRLLRGRFETNHLRNPQPTDPELTELDNEQTDGDPSLLTVGDEEAATEEKEENVDRVHDTTDCPSCDDGLTSQEETRKLRIEKIKEKILHKLRLKSRPNITISKADLPTPLSHGELSRFRAFHEPHLKYDYYGTTEHVIIFPDEDSYPCFLPRQHPAQCLHFSKNNSFSDGEISSAELWVYKLRDKNDHLNQTFRIAELAPDHRNAARRNLVDQLETSVDVGWVKFDVKHAVRRWRHRPHAERWLEVICHTCATHHSHSPVSMGIGQRPFLVLSMNNNRERQRSKRSVNCVPGTTHCCRKSLFISFKEIGWDDWIIQPAGYTANYCQGSCAEDVAISLSQNYHSTMMQRYVQKQNLTPSQRNSLSPCCTPARMSQISLLYVYEDGQVYQSNLPDMIVDACGCS